MLSPTSTSLMEPPTPTDGNLLLLCLIGLWNAIRRHAFSSSPWTKSFEKLRHLLNAIISHGRSCKTGFGDHITPNVGDAKIVPFAIKSKNQRHTSSSNCHFTTRFRTGNPIVEWLPWHSPHPLGKRQRMADTIRFVKRKDLESNSVHDHACLVETWKARNVTVFRHHATASTISIIKVKKKARIWSFARAKIK